MGKNLASWKKKFFAVAIGQTFSLIGSSAVQFALIWWLAKETSSPMVMSIAGIMMILPQMLLGPFAGVWIDRMKRKTVVVLADMFMGLAAALFAAAFAVGWTPTWAVFAVLLVRSFGSVFHAPAIQSLIPMLAPSEELMKVNGWNQFMQGGAYMLGPVFGALLFGACSMPVILLVDTAGALIASGMLMPISIEEPAKENTQYPDFIREFKEGIRVFQGDKRLMRVLLSACICMVFFMPIATLYPLMSSDYFRVDAFHAGLIEVLYAVGMMLAALLVGRINSNRDKLSLSLNSLLGLGVTSLIAGLLPAGKPFFWAFAVLCLLMGAGGNAYGLPLTTYMQQNIEPEKMGRAFSVMSSAMSMTMPIGLVIAGPCAERFGVASWFFVSGVAILLVISAMRIWDRRVERKRA